LRGIGPGLELRGIGHRVQLDRQRTSVAAGEEEDGNIAFL
jgi:hypothetical protein